MQNNAILKEVSNSKEKSFIASIDVVITSHKQTMYLEEAIKSVLIQTFQPQTVIVVIHDEDPQEKLHAEQIIVNYEKLIDIKMLVINECWPGEARNAGSRLSNADAIVFLDVDDVFESNYFFNCILYMNYYNLDFVGSWCSTFGKGVSTELWSIPFHPELQNYVSGNASPVGSVIRSEFLREINGWRDFDFKKDKIDEALDFWRRAKLSNGDGINFQNPFILLRRHSRNRSSADSEAKFFNPRVLRKQMKHYYRDFPEWKNLQTNDLQLSSTNLRRFFDCRWKKNQEVVVLLIADAKAFGAGKVAVELLEKLNLQGIEVLVINLDINGLGFGVEKLSQILSRSPIIELGSACPPNNWILFLRQVLIHFHVKAIISLGHPFANDLLVTIKSEQPEITSCAFVFNTESLHAKWISSNPNKIDKVVVESTHASSWALDQGWFPSRLEKIAHSAHNVGFESVNIITKKTGPLKVLWFSRFSSEKQPEMFIQLARLAQNNLPSVQFIMGGVGPLRNDIEKKIMDLNLDNLHLLDVEISNTEALAIADVLIMTSSKVEGRPLVCSEALESGLVLILPLLPGPLDFVTDGFQDIYTYSRQDEVLKLLISLDLDDLRNSAHLRAIVNREIASSRVNVTEILENIIR
jgi:glycosyltransferase involved in cell wall biosynthesis